MSAESDASSMEITFKTITQEVFKISLPFSITINEVKKKIFENKGSDYEVDRLKLIYNGKVLDDAQVLRDINFDQKKYIVVMVSRKKVEPSAAQPSSVPEVAKAPTPPPQTTESSSVPAPVAQDTSLTPEQENAVSLISAMGYPRQEVIRALIAAFWDSDRAVEYLCTGIPENTEAADEMNPDEAPNSQESEENQDVWAALLESPQFAQICEMVRAQPSMLPEVLNTINQTNPELMAIIRQNQQAFLEILNAVTGGEIPQMQNPAGGEEAEGQALRAAQEAGFMTINVTEADQAAIERIKSMGFPEQLVVEAYFACDKNEDLAVNYILSQMEQQSNQK